MTRYVLVTVRGRLPVERFHTIEAAAGYAKNSPRELRLLVQEAGRITPHTPYRELRPTEVRVWRRAFGGNV